MTAPVIDAYNDIRAAIRRIGDPVVDCETTLLNPDAAPGSTEGKPPYRLKELYPNIERYRTVSTDRWHSREVMQAEWEKMWTQAWLMAGRVQDCAEAGDWFKFDIGAESIIVVRGKDEEIRAFYNACTHRGNRLVRDDWGKNFKCFTCSFHSWMYSTEGKNVRVTDRETFAPEVVNEDVHLREIHTRVFGGFVFVNMADDPQPFEDYFRDVLPWWEKYGMDRMHVVKDVTVMVPANWKLTMDAFQEIYHLHQTHPQALPYVQDYLCQYDFYANGHNRMMVPLGDPTPRIAGDNSLNPVLSYLLMEVGVDPATFTGGQAAVRKAIQQAKRRPDNAFGVDYSNFTDNQTTDDWNITLFPNTTFNAHPEGVLIQRFRPHESDPEQCYYDVMVICAKLKPGMRPPAYMGVEPDVDVSGATRPPRKRTHITQPGMGEVLDQDANNIPFVQLGSRSRGMRGVARYSEQEKRIQQFYAEIDLYLSGKKARS
jgi:phenylpropionate dioxygenase-like ring-hydroxylating dioxygenase large terminal subunit